MHRVAGEPRPSQIRLGLGKEVHKEKERPVGIYAFADPPVLGEATATACADAQEPTTMTKYYYSSLMERYEEQVQQYARGSMRPIIDDDARSIDFPGESASHVSVQETVRDNLGQPVGNLTHMPIITRFRRRGRPGGTMHAPHTSAFCI